MMLAASLAIVLTLSLYGEAPWTLALPVALVAAPVAGGIELVSRDGLDTVTVPLGSAVAIVTLLIGLAAFEAGRVAAGS